MSYVITSARETGTITYHCRSPRSALDKLYDFQQADYHDIRVTLGKQVVSERQLCLLLAQEAAVPVGA